QSRRTSTICRRMKTLAASISRIALLTSIAAFVTVSARAEEKLSALQTALSSTTISGYVNTSAQWDIGTGNGGSANVIVLHPGRGTIANRSLRPPPFRRVVQPTWQRRSLGVRR